MSINIRDCDLLINWVQFNEYCNDGMVERKEYWHNVELELAKFEATFDKETRIITFNSKERHTLFILRWS